MSRGSGKNFGGPVLGKKKSLRHKPEATRIPQIIMGVEAPGEGGQREGGIPLPKAEKKKKGSMQAIVAAQRDGLAAKGRKGETASPPSKKGSACRIRSFDHLFLFDNFYYIMQPWESQGMPSIK